MRPLLLDTNIIIDVLRRRHERHLLIEQFLDQGQPLASCPITLIEIYAGMRPHEEKITRGFMTSLLFLSITEEIAEHAGRLKARFSKAGKALSFQDVSIAAVCIAYDCTLVTENIKDFPMRDLKLYPLPGAAK
jgi:predicted nucleic acid-binding protein